MSHIKKPKMEVLSFHLHISLLMISEENEGTFKRELLLIF